MKTQHTPGPWHSHRVDRNTTEILQPDGGDWICKMNPKNTPEANARLIAAAPELLEALIEAKELLESVRPRMPKSIRNNETFHFENVLANSITKVIQKATQP